MGAEAEEDRTEVVEVFTEAVEAVFIRPEEVTVEAARAVAHRRRPQLATREAMPAHPLPDMPGRAGILLALTLLQQVGE